MFLYLSGPLTSLPTSPLDQSQHCVTTSSLLYKFCKLCNREAARFATLKMDAKVSYDVRRCFLCWALFPRLVVLSSLGTQKTDSIVPTSVKSLQDQLSLSAARSTYLNSRCFPPSFSIAPLLILLPPPNIVLISNQLLATTTNSYRTRPSGRERASCCHRQ